jgi:isopentenyl-diphosphate Delta-isomerase
MMNGNVILVDENDRQTGIAEKLQAHKKGLLHRAFSVFIFNDDGDWLLQQRAPGKYHSGGLWTNACCSHPAPGEDTQAAAHRRLVEELGFDTEIEKIFHFVYKAHFENGLTENEYDHVFAGKYSGTLNPDPMEVMNTRFLSIENIKKEISNAPYSFTEWFKIALESVESWKEKQML